MAMPVDIWTTLSIHSLSPQRASRLSQTISQISKSTTTFSSEILHSEISSPYLISAVPTSTPTFAYIPTHSSPPSRANTNANTTAQSFSPWSQMNNTSEALLIIGLSILGVILSIITLYLFDRYKYREKHVLPFSDKNKNNINKNINTNINNNEKIHEKIIINNNVITNIFTSINPTTILDEHGIRWPEKVVLQGDAKEFHAWTVQYEKEHRFRASLREGRYRLLDRDGVGVDGIGVV